MNINDDYKEGYEHGCEDTLYAIADTISGRWKDFANFCICDCGDCMDDSEFADKLTKWFKEEALY